MTSPNASRAQYAASEAHKRRPPHARGWHQRPCGPTPQDLRILWMLMRVCGRIVTYGAMVDELYADREGGGPLEADRIVKQSAGSLNYFLAPHNEGRRVIENVRGIGYRLPRATIVPEEWQPPIGRWAQP